MAFTPRVVAGLAPGLTLVTGAYTHTAGAAEETLTVTGGAVYMVLINGQLAQASVHQGNSPGYSTSQSGALLTLTVYGLATVTDGTFAVLVGT